MAKLSNINGKFAVEDTGAIRFSDQTGTTGQILKSNGNSAPTWVDPNTVGTGPWLPLAGGIVSGPTTFQSSLTVGATAVFNGDMTLPAAADHFLIGAGSLQTTGRIKFGLPSWNNSIGLESYWMVMRSNSNEGYKFIDSGGNTYVQFNASTNSAGAYNATFAGNITFGDSHFIGDDADDNLLIQSSANENIIINSPDDDVLIRTAGATRLQITNTLATFAGDVKIAEASNKGQLFFGTANTDYEIKGGGNYGYLSLNAPILRFDTGGSERIRINSSGDVGIGTTPETAGPTWRTLFIGASATIVSRQAASGYDSIFANNYYVNSSNQDRVRTTGPSSRMFLDGNNIRFQISPSTGVGGSPTWSEIMRIDDSGNVGIGTTSPTSNLDIFSTGTSTLTLSYPGGSGSGSTIDFSLINSGVSQPLTTQIKAIDDGAFRQNLSFLTKTSATGASGLSTRMTILANGNVGIGTTGPPSKITVMESTLCTNSGTDGGTSYVPAKPILLVTTDGNGTPSSFYGTNSVFTVGIGGGITGGVTTKHLSVLLNGKVNIGTGTTVTGFLNIEKTGNHLHLRNSGATSGQYWNFDVASQNRLYILNHANTGVYISSGDTSWTANSDESLKENINNLQNVLPIIDNYRCVKYNLISNPEQIKIGFIAQDWQEDFPEIINTDKNNKLGIKYTETIPVLLKAIQELKADNDSLKARIEILENN